MQLFVKGESLHAVNLADDETVGQLKGIMSSMEGIPIEEQVLSYGGVMLEDQDRVSELVLPGATLELTGRLYGGKIVCAVYIFTFVSEPKFYTFNRVGILPTFCVDHVSVQSVVVKSLFFV